MIRLCGDLRQLFDVETVEANAGFPRPELPKFSLGLFLGGVSLVAPAVATSVEYNPHWLSPE